MIETPEMQSQLVSAHGMLAIMEVLESRTSRDVTLKLLQIINAVCLLQKGSCRTTLIYLVACEYRYGLPGELLFDWVQAFFFMTFFLAKSVSAAYQS